MEHKGTVRIETERLILRRFVAGDAPAVFQNWTRDDRVTEFLRWPAHRSEEVTRCVLADWIRSYGKPDFYQWAITLKDDVAEPIGTISAFDANEQVASITIGYCIGMKWWNRGITSEAFSGIIPFLIDAVKVNRIVSYHDPHNPHSGRVMLRCGLTYEGTLRQADFSNRGIVDAAYYSLLADEFRAGQAGSAPAAD